MTAPRIVMPTLAVALAVMAATVAVTDELTDAVAQTDALSLFTRISLQQDQARAMVAPLQRIQSIVQQAGDAQEQRLEALAPTLRQARALLAAGDQLPADVQAALADYRRQREQAQLALYRGVDQEMRMIADLMYPEQNALLDWTPPAAVRTEDSLQEQLRLRQIAEARIDEAGRMLERVKYLDAFNFVTARTPIINDYLARYFDPNAPNYQTAYRICIDYTDRVRVLSEDEWQANGWDIAAQLIDRLGLMPTLETAPAPGTITWPTLYRVFTNPQTLQVVQRFVQVQ